MDETDETIAERVQTGDTEAFGILIDRYEKKLKRYARRFLFQADDVDDLIQDVFLKAYSNIQGFNTKQKFSSWVYRIAHNTFINVIKKRERDPIIPFEPDVIFNTLQAEEESDKATLQKEREQLVGEALEKIDIKYREILILYYFEELSYKEIADVLKIPTSTVGVRVARAKKQMKKMYSKENI